MSFLKATATIGGLTLLSRIAGFLRDILMAVMVGAGAYADAFFVALKLPNLFRRITAEGAMSIAFIPVFSELLEQEGDKAAHDYARNMLLFLFWIIAPVSILVIYFMPYIIMAIAPGFDGAGQRYDLAVELSRITFPYLLVMSLTALIGGMLNAHGRYAPFAAAPVIFNICLIAALLLHGYLSQTAVHALSYAVAISGLMQLVWVWFFVRKTGFSARIGFPKATKNTRKTLKLMIPAILGAGVMHINLFVDIILASMLPAGAISYLYYADRLAQLPLGVIGIAIGTALLPMLSRAVAGDDGARAEALFKQALKMGAAFAVPAAAAFIVMAPFILMTLFAHGAFSTEDAQATSYVLMAYAAGMPAYVACKAYSNVFYAHQDTKTPLIMASISACCNILLSLLLIRFLGVTGIAAATAIAGWMQLVLLGAMGLRRELCALDLRTVMDLLKIVMAAIVMGCLLWGGMIYAQMILGELAVWSVSQRIILLAAFVIFGLIIYGALIMVLRVIAVRDVKALFSRQKIENIK